MVVLHSLGSETVSLHRMSAGIAHRLTHQIDHTCKKGAYRQNIHTSSTCEILSSLSCRIVTCLNGSSSLILIDSIARGKQARRAYRKMYHKRYSYEIFTFLTDCNLALVVSENSWQCEVFTSIFFNDRMSFFTTK